MARRKTSGFSTIQYNTTVKRDGEVDVDLSSFSTIQYNTTVKRYNGTLAASTCFSTIQYNTTVKPHVCGFTEVNVVALTWYYRELVLKS